VDDFDHHSVPPSFPTRRSSDLELFPLSTVITPNLDEISELIQRRVDDVEKMEKAGEQLLQSTGVQAVLVKGGHLDAEILTTLLRSEEHTSELQSREKLVCRLLL